MPRILPEPDMLLYEYITVPKLGTTGVGMNNRARILRKRDGTVYTPPAPQPLILDGTSPTGAYSASRKLLTAYNSPFYTEDAGQVSSLLDQSGNTRNLVQANAVLQPVLETKFGKQGLRFKPTGSQLVGGMLPEFITPTSAYMIVSFSSDAISQAQIQGSKVVTDSAEGGFIITAQMNSVPDYGIYGLQFDGNYDLTPHVPMQLDTRYVVEFRKTDTTMYLRVNRGTEVEVPNATLTAMNYNLWLSGAGNRLHNGMIWEFAIWSAIPDETKRNQIAASFMSNVGLSV